MDRKGDDTRMTHSMPPPPVGERDALSEPVAIQVPSIHLTTPVAQAATAVIKRALGGAFQSAVLIVVIDMSREKARYSMQLVAISSFGELEAPYASRELFDAVTLLITEDAKSGNGRWRKLVIRFSPQGYGTSVGKIDVF